MLCPADAELDAVAAYSSSRNRGTPELGAVKSWRAPIAVTSASIWRGRISLRSLWLELLLPVGRARSGHCAGRCVDEVLHQASWLPFGGIRRTASAVVSCGTSGSLRGLAISVNRPQIGAMNVARKLVALLGADRLDAPQARFVTASAVWRCSPGP